MQTVSSLQNGYTAFTLNSQEDYIIYLHIMSIICLFIYMYTYI